MKDKATKEGKVDVDADPVPDMPMPNSREEVERQFNLTLAELNLPDDKLEMVKNLPLETKWRMVTSHMKSARIEVTLSAAQYIEKLHKSLEVDAESGRQQRSLALEGLSIALKGQTLSFVRDFIDQKGLTLVLDLLNSFDFEERKSIEHRNALRCLQSLMNNSLGLKCVLSHQNCVTVLATCLHSDDPSSKTMVYEMLGALCLIPTGHKKVLEAMTHFRYFASERTRFQTVVADLAHEWSHLVAELKVAAMGLVNALICAGPGRQHVEFRQHIRYEFFMLGIDSIMDRLKKYGNQQLIKHVEIFDDVSLDDMDQLAAAYAVQNIDLHNTLEVFQHLDRNLQDTPAYVYFQSIICHLLSLPGDIKTKPLYFRFLDLVVQQVVIQTEDGVNPDQEPITNLDISKVISSFSADDQILEAKKERNKAILSKEDYKSRCRAADEKLKDMKADKDILKKSLMRKILKLKKEFDILKETSDAKRSELQDEIAKLSRILAEKSDEANLHYSLLSRQC